MTIIYLIASFYFMEGTVAFKEKKIGKV